MLDNTQRVVLVTGGSKGIGKEIAMKFAEHGDQVIITYGWGSVEEEDIIADFTAKGLPAPYLKQADVINIEDTIELLNDIKNRFGKLDVFISNVSFTTLVKCNSNSFCLLGFFLDRSFPCTAFPVPWRGS